MFQTRHLEIENYLPLVGEVIRGCFHPNESIQGLGYEDLYQTGCEALCHAAHCYDDTRGASFKTFASHVIRNAIYSHCRKIRHQQEKLEYLDAPLPDASGLTYADTLADTTSLENVCALRLSDQELLIQLAKAEKQYTGISKKGVHALRMKCLGYRNQEIAVYYGVNPKHVAAWISRAGSKLRNDHLFDEMCQTERRKCS